MERLIRLRIEPMPKKEKHPVRKIRHTMPPPTKVKPNKKAKEERKRARKRIEDEE